MATLEDFEDGDLSGFGGNTGDFSVETTKPYEGSYSATGGGYGKVISDTGKTVSQGDTPNGYIWSSSDTYARGWLLFGAQNENAYSNWSGYAVEIEQGSDQLSIVKVSNGSKSELKTGTGSVSSNAWYKVEVDWQTDGTISATLKDTNGNQVVSTTTTDTNYTSGGIGFGSNGGGTHYYDLYKDAVIKPPSTPQNLTVTET